MEIWQWCALYLTGAAFTAFLTPICTPEQDDLGIYGSVLFWPIMLVLYGAFAVIYVPFLAMWYGIQFFAKLGKCASSAFKRGQTNA